MDPRLPFTTPAAYERDRKARLEATRRADNEHEEMMQRAARLAGADLKAIRAMKRPAKDRALSAMFAKARGAE